MADARTTSSGQGIAVGGGYGSSSRRDPSGHERVQAQRAEANVREQEARRLGTWKEGVGVMSKQQLAGEARDKALWEQNRSTQNQTSMATPPVRNEYDEAGTGMTPEQQDAADANKRKAQEQAYNPRTFQDRRQNAMISAVQEARNAQQMRPATPRPFMGVTTGYVPENRIGVPGASRYADPTQGVVPIAPQYQVAGKSPFGYVGTPEYKEGQMVRATSSPITRDGRQTGIQGASNNNWQQAVVNKYNDIGIAGTPMNRAYVQAVKAQTGEFDPMKLAESISKQAPARTERIGELYQIDPETGRRLPPPPPMGHEGDATGVARTGATLSVQPPQSQAPNTATQQQPNQEQPDINRRNWVDKLVPSDEQIKQFEQNYDAQRSLGGQIVEALKNPMAWYYSNQNKEINADIEAANTPEALRAQESKMRAEAEQRNPEIKRRREAREALDRQAQAGAASQRARREL
jgi:hypothetical protein